MATEFIYGSGESRRISNEYVVLAGDRRFEPACKLASDLDNDEVLSVMVDVTEEPVGAKRQNSVSIGAKGHSR